MKNNIYEHTFKLWNFYFLLVKRGYCSRRSQDRDRHLYYINLQCFTTLTIVGFHTGDVLKLDSRDTSSLDPDSRDNSSQEPDSRDNSSLEPDSRDNSSLEPDSRDNSS